MFVVAYRADCSRILGRPLPGHQYRSSNCEPFITIHYREARRTLPRLHSPEATRRGVDRKGTHAAARTATTTHTETPVSRKFSSFPFLPCPFFSLHIFFWVGEVCLYFCSSQEPSCPDRDAFSPLLFCFPKASRTALTHVLSDYNLFEHYSVFSFL